jgi:hypothetical protein
LAFIIIQEVPWVDWLVGWLWLVSFSMYDTVTVQTDERITIPMHLEGGGPGLGDTQ